MDRDRDQRATEGSEVDRTGASVVGRQQAAFSVRGGGQDEAVLGHSRRERPKHRFVASTQSVYPLRLNVGLDSAGGWQSASVGEVVGSGR
jgi:hypothetical protein